MRAVGKAMGLRRLAPWERAAREGRTTMRVMQKVKRVGCDAVLSAAGLLVGYGLLFSTLARLP